MAKPQANQTKTDDESFSEEETERRRDDALKRALSTPPRQHQEDVGKVKTVKQPKHIRKADDDGSNSD